MRERAVKRLLLVLILPMVVALPSSAWAYSVFGGEWVDPDSLTWRWSGTSYPSLATAFGYAVSDWNNAGTVIYLTQVGSGEDITGYEYYQNDSYNGYALMEPDWYSYFSHGEAYLNWYNLWDDTSTEKRSTACHEIGHCLGLGHTADTHAVMCEIRDRATYYYPNTDDKNGIDYLYNQR
jgi:hypothetical protein